MKYFQINQSIRIHRFSKHLISAKQNKNEKLVNNINNGLIGLRNDINRKEIPKNENLKKVIDIAKTIWTLINNKKVMESIY